MTAAATYHVGHLSVALLRHDWDSPLVAEFVNGLDIVNDIAARSDGFVENIVGEELEAQISANDDPLTNNPRYAVALSVWKDTASLDHFVHKTLHERFLRRRAEWFEELPKPIYVVWPINAGHRPSYDEALKRLKMLGENGPSSEAFDLKWHRDHACRKDEANA